MIEKTKKITILGAGTAGCYSAAFFDHHLFNSPYEVEWIFDPSIKPQAVGEGSTLDFPLALETILDFNYNHLKEIHGTFKQGIMKMNWGKQGKDFMHYFPLARNGLHFNATELQQFIIRELLHRPKLIKVHTKNIQSYDEVDADVILDCRGTPRDFGNYELIDTIPVNSVYVTQCYWDLPTFDTTLACARPYGWVFGIPLTNRCSIGYLYNKDITGIEQVKEDVQQIFKDHNLTPSTDTNSFSFKNYHRKINFTDRVIYNGNASFFMEPLEATSIWLMGWINRITLDVLAGWSNDEANTLYLRLCRDLQHLIGFHYAAGSKWDNEFWKHAQKVGLKSYEQMIEKGSDFYNFFQNNPKTGFVGAEYGTWGATSYDMHFKNIGLPGPDYS